MDTWLDLQDADKVARNVAAYREGKTRTRVGEYDGGDDRFGLWLYLVDRRLARAVGVGLFDLADCNTRDMYEGGYSPREAMVEALRNDDTYAGLVEEAGL